MERITKHKSQD